jgi:hypothetical protein
VMIRLITFAGFWFLTALQVLAFVSFMQSFFYGQLDAFSWSALAYIVICLVFCLAPVLYYYAFMER